MLREASGWMMRHSARPTFWRQVAATGLALILCLGLSLPHHAYGRARAHAAPAASHLYVLLGLNNNSPGLAEFGEKMQARGIPATVENYSAWQSVAQDAIREYRSGRLRTIMIVGHSLGGAAAMDMAAALGRQGVPVRLVVTLDPVGGGTEAPNNVGRSILIRPTGGEDHYSVIAAHEGDLTAYVLGAR